MLNYFLQRRLLSERAGLLVSQAVIFAGAVLIVGFAFIKMAALGLSEVQWLTGLAIVTGLVLQCLILVALIDLRRSRDVQEPGVGTATVQS